MIQMKTLSKHTNLNFSTLDVKHNLPFDLTIFS